MIKCKACGEAVFVSHLKVHWKEQHSQQARLVASWLENVDDKLAGMERQIREQEGLE
jgi:hypothetical protein